MQPIKFRVSLTQLLVATACIAAAFAAIQGITIPASYGAFDARPFGFYAIFLGLFSASICVGIAVWVLGKRIFFGFVCIFIAYFALCALIVQF